MAAEAEARRPGAFDPVDNVLRKLRAQRERWVDVGNGRRVQVLVLRETELPSLARRPLVDIVCEQAVDWAGFSEAAIFGEHDGASDKLPFDATVWGELARNDVDIVTRVGNVLIQAAEAAMAARAAAKKA
jgi:hypothetical protein